MNRNVLFSACLVAALASEAQWIELAPAVDWLSLHHRVEASPNASFGIDIAQGDTILWSRFEVEMPSLWADDVAGSMDVKVNFYNENVLESTNFVAIFPEKAKSTDISMKIMGSPQNAAIEIGVNRAAFIQPLVLADSVPLFVRFHASEKAKSLRKEHNFMPKADMQSSDFKSIDELKNYLRSSKDPNEGMWIFYDRTTAPLLASPNGEYVLATVKTAGGYHIVYIDDRQKIPSRWKPLTIKGFIKDSEIPGVFDALWIDREGAPVNVPISAVVDGAFLTINFPYYKTSLRFSKISNYK